MAKPHSTIAYAVLTYIAVLVALSGCTKKDAENESAHAPQLGTVRQADINSCPATSTSCSLLSDRDTTVYQGRAVDYGKGHEICVGYAPTGANSNAVANGAARALLHFPLGLLPSQAVVTDATLTLHGQRGRNAGVMALSPLTDDSWLEGDGTGNADGAGNTGDGACGWQGTTTSRASFTTTGNVTSPTVTASVAAPPSDAVFSGLGPAVRAQLARNNFGWAVNQTNETGSGMNNQVFIFWSKETGVGGDSGRPTLNLTYGKGPGSSCTASSDCLFGNGSAGFCASNHVCCSTSCANANQCSFGVCAANGACSQQVLTGAACNDGDPCKTGDTCQSNGSCTGTPIVCPAPDQCHTQATCSNGSCPPNPPKTNGSTCTDGNACTTGDSCQGGNCTGTQVVCTALDQCHVPGSCSNGTCSNPTKMDGLTCDDGNSCTSGEACHGGVCNGGTGMTCPLADQCHTQASCSGGVCPANPPKTNGTPCDDGNSCTTGETCQSGACTGGTGMTCPPADQCHTQASCSGGTCPVNPPKTNGTPCNDANACTSGETCQSGTCGGGTPMTCTALDQCHVAGTCSGGVCSNPTKQNGSTCDDGNSCSTGETCQNGSCTGGTGITCTALDQCHVAGTCSNGVCSNPTKSNGTPCDDSNACTTGETCQSGTCGGGTPITCTALDQCHVAGTCSGGTCTNPAKTNGTPCNDSNACTAGETCQSGVCGSGTPTTCTALDQCHLAGTCDPASGSCSNPTKSNGSPCNDGNACTQVDTCQAGSCSGGNPVACPVPDQCHNQGTCNPSSGVCSNPVKTDGTTCDDGKICTTGDKCAGGVCGGAARVCDDGIACTVDGCSETAGGCTVNTSACGCTTNANCNDGNPCNGVETCNMVTLTCVSGTPIDCSSLNNACNTGTCNPANGTCSAAPKPNGTTCNDASACTQSDTCQAGSCIGGNPISCAPLDQCHVAGTCNPSTGTCNNPNKTNGAACDDGNSCTSGETCQNGACTGGTGKVCTASDQCHDVGTCNGGVCTDPIKTNGATCSDGNACTTADSCQNGVCTGGPSVQCTPLDQCHTAGTCSPSTGTCSNPNKANGTACDDGKFCTTPDTCTNGACGGPARVCNDGIACTVDACSDGTGRCTTDPSPCGCTTNAGCDDGNACNGAETCDLSTFSCKPGTAVDCRSQDDGCNVGVCSPSTGACSKAPKTNGTACDDANACTRTDACQAGKCVGSNPVVCTALDQCHGIGTCNPATGVCSNPAAPNGSACDDGNACTSNDVCSSGACQAGPSIDCTDTNPCTAEACDTAVGCIKPAGNQGAACGATASCSGGKETLASACNGASATCPANVVHDCAPYACGSTACLKACTKDADCSLGNYCATGGKCTPKGNPGATCTSSNQCLSSFCVDGVCCNDDCVGQCEACNLPTKVGTCSPVTGKPIGSRPACAGNGTGCDGACNGVQTTACVVPGQSTQCRKPSCDAATSVATLAEYCNGSGACPDARTQECKPGICGVTQCTGCSTNADCPKGDFCRGGVCKPLSGTGTACSVDAECTSGHCVDAVCCDSDCTGQCEACNQKDHEGECTPIAGGQEPAKGRPGCAGAGTECGGVCDGTTTRTCTYPGPGVPCRDAACQNGTATLVAFCDGSGSCPPLGQETCPTGYACSKGGLCTGGPGACLSDGDCNNDEYCAGGVCKAKNRQGVACNTSVECESGICIDGMCCTQACTGQCEACNVTGNEGICTPVTGAPRGSRQACATDGTECGGVCDGITPDRCTYKGAGTQCRAGACRDGLADLAAFCQGNGSCAPRQQQSCDPYACDTAGVLCDGPCKANPASCSATQYCAAGVCTAKQPNGATCGAPAQCASGQCVDGLCCDKPCDGQCESCDQVGQLGTCVAVAGAPRDGRPSCEGSGACGGFCDGKTGTSCVLPGVDVVCGEAYCANAASTDAPKCSGVATCVVPNAKGCDPFQCGDQGKCLTSCVGNGDCSPGLVCSQSGDCTQPVPDAGVVPTPDASAGGSPTGVDSGTSSGGSNTGGSAGTFGSGGGPLPSGTGGATASVDGGIGPEPDAGTGREKDQGSGRSDGGCGCRVRRSSDTSSNAMIVLAALSLLRMRRRAGNRRVTARSSFG